MAGFNGDPTVQYLVITVGGNDQKAWGPQPGETSSRAMLVFFDSNGVQTGTFFFPNNPPQGGLSVLIATTNFANVPGAPVPDILIPPLIQPGSGKVVFRGNPASSFRFDVNLALSYGTFPANLTEGAGPPAPALPLTGEPLSLTRIQNFSFGNNTSRNGDFAPRPAAPINTRGETFAFPVDGPEIDASPTALDFAGQNIAAGPTAARTVTITSRGTVNPLIVSNITLVGIHSNQFQITGGAGAVTLAPAETRTVTLIFDPSSVGAKSAALRITSNDTNEMITDVALTGFGIDPNAPDIAVTQTTIDFGTRDIALGAGASIAESILNQGTIGTLVISNLSLVGANTNDFRIVSDTAQASLGPGAARTLSLIFTPTSAGPKSAALRIVSNDPDEGLVLAALSGFAFDLSPCTAPNPTNSVAQTLCTNAMLVCPGPVFSGPLLTVGTPDGDSSCSPPFNDLWFRYVPGANGTLVATLLGIGAVPALSAHSGCPGNTANELACQLGGNGQITLPVTAGMPVLLRVVAAAVIPIPGQTPQFQLTLAGPPCFDFDKNRNGTTDICESDFGSAPAPFPTTLAQNGARHRAFSGVLLGTRIDPNDDGLPSVGATGDKLDGPENDEDGVLWTSPLVVGGSASLNITASTNGFLNAWLDFNADGDWSDAGEQIFTNAVLAVGGNALSFPVPSIAIVTNRAYTRFRFNSTGNLGITGPANDGEVEDYALEILPATVTPGALQVRINEVMAGLNGDSTVQFVELEANGAVDKLWGPLGNETAGRAMLTFFDEAGNQIGRFVFPSNAPAGASTVLVATRAFQEQTGLRPDFVMPPDLSPIGGKVAFQANPDNLRFAMNIALSYGSSRYFGVTDGAGPANTNELPILGAKTLTRTAAVPFGVNQNTAFSLLAPTPRNTAGQTATLTEAPLRDQGRTIFTRETFRGDGRTCATCHIADGRDQFGLTPLSILDLPEEDPLFVFEKNVNVMKLILRSQPSDLRGPLTGTLGTGRVLGGSGDTFLILGGTNLAGIIADTNGNTGLLQTITPGNLSGPTPGNGSPRGLEDHELLEHGRGLILENIDGFKRREVFRASPHLLNIKLTAPYGLSGEFSNLDDFSLGAVIQHFPRSLARVSGVDFRHPTGGELAAMTEFMNTISHPADQNFNLDRFATTEAQKRGRTMFFNSEGKCSKCHSGPTLNFSDGSLFGTLSNAAARFNTGVANLERNLADGLPTEPAGLPSGQSAREFDTPSLIAVRLTAPFFHDGAAPNLTEAVKFYDSEEFVQSPAGQLTGTILAANRSEKVADLVAFLESLVELPVDFPRELSFGVLCPGTPIEGPFTATVTNTSATTVSITNVFLNGTNAADFSIVADTGETTLAPGGTRRVTVAFTPMSAGAKSATLEFIAVDTNLLGQFEFGVALSAANVDNIVTAGPTSLDFGTRDIDAPPSPEVSILLTNSGSIAIDLGAFAVTGDAQDFIVTADLSPVAANTIRIIQISFAPKTQGAKSASVLIPVLACNTELIEIPLTGAASSTVHHFGWDPLATTQYVGTPFPVRLTAQDRNNDTVATFGGTVTLMSVLGTQTNTLAISPTNSAPFQNGIWTGFLNILQPANSVRLLARDNQGHAGLSTAFLAPLRDDLSLLVSDSPDPVVGGQAMTYAFTVHNTGPNEATGVVVTNTLSPGVNFVSGTASQGNVTEAMGIVSWQLGRLTRGATATGSVVVLPRPGFSLVTNIATARRNEPETNLANNTATNTTVLQPFGLLTVTPLTNFISAGFTGGPFAPTNQTYVLSNAGTAALNWRAQGGTCTLPTGIRGWWPLDGNTLDSVSTNTGSPLGSPIFTDGLVGPALLFDGADDAVRIPASPGLNVGIESGLTMEAWINPQTVAVERPVLEWSDGSFGIGAHLWISVSGGAGGGPGSVFANLVDTSNNSHQIGSAGDRVVTNAWQHIAVTYSKASGLATLYLNGIVVTQQNLGNFTPKTDTDLFIGRRIGQSFFGLIDEPAVYDRALTTTEIQAIFVSGPAGKCKSRPGDCNTAVGIVAWWPLDSNPTDLGGTNHGTLVGHPVFTNGLVGPGLFFDGVTDALRVATSPELNLGTKVGFTFETWVNVPDANHRSPIFAWDDGSGFSGPLFYISGGQPGGLHFNLVDVANGIHFFNTPGGIIASNEWQHLALTYNRNSGMATLYLNGNVLAQPALGSFTMKTVGSLHLGRSATSSGAFETLLGTLDEPTFYDRELTQDEIQSIVTARAAGKCSNRNNCNLPDGLVGWWPLEGNTGDRVSATGGILVGNPVFTNGFVNRAMFFDGDGDGVMINPTNSLNVGTNEGFSFEAWVNLPNVARRSPVFEWDDGSAAAGPFLFVGVDGPGSLFADITGLGNSSHIISNPSNLVSASSWHHVALTFNRSNGLTRIYLNGVTVQEQSFGSFTPRTAGNLFLGRRAATGFEESFLGVIDEPSVYSRELGASEVQSIFLAGAAGKCPNQSWFNQSQFAGTLAPGARTNVVISINTNANVLAVGTYSAPIQFANVSNARDTAERTMLLRVLNRPPTLNPLAPLVMAEDSGPRTVLLSGIAAGGSEIQFLTVSASSAQPNLIPNPVSVSYTSPNTNGSITFAPVTNAHGTSVISVVVRDSGGTANGTVDARTNTFVVTVTPVNDPPTLIGLPDRTIAENSLVTITNAASDVDLPDDALTFSLITPPTGAVLDPATGIFTWTPTETQGPGTNVITVVVRDSGVPQLSATNRFTLFVSEVNSGPTLLGATDQTIHLGTTVTLSLFANDADVPANALTYSLGPAAPAGATIHPTSGLFAWTPAGIPVPTTNTVTFVVTDNGVPPLSDTRSVRIVIVDRPLIQSITYAGGTVTLRWHAIPGATYRVQFKSNLNDAVWTDLLDDVAATDVTASKTDAPGPATRRFYQIKVLP